MLVSMHSRIAVLMLICMCFLPTHQQFVCYQSWSSDGNYYDFDQCMSTCRLRNQAQNVTNVQQLATNCCTPICQSEIAYHTGKRTAVIVVVSILLFMVFLCCMFGCFGPSIKKRYVLHEQGQLRKTVSNGMSPQQFDKFASQFQCIFTEDQRENWELYFIVENQKFLMQWYTFEMKKKRDYKYEIEICGQDGYGLWNVDGYLTNTEKGVTIWGVKNYENVENSSILFDKHSQIILELSRTNNEDYTGVWYKRKQKSRSGECAVKRKGQLIKSHSVLDKFDIVSE